MSTDTSFDKIDIKAEILSLINNNSHPFHKYYSKLANEIMSNNKVILSTY